MWYPMSLRVRCTQLVYWRWTWPLGTHVFTLRVAALQLPRCVYTSPGAAAVRGCWKQVMLSRLETSGYEITLQQPSVVAWPSFCPWLREPGLLEFQSLLRISDFKKNWKEDPVLSISIPKMEEEGALHWSARRRATFSYFPRWVLTEFWFHFNVPRGLKIWNWPQRILSVIKIHKSLRSRCCRDTS